MTISEMHIMFRQYAQQMGMQNVRGILPEQIDVLLNGSITDMVNQYVTFSIGVTSDRILPNTVELNKINALRTLYKEKTLSLVGTTPSMDFLKANAVDGKMVHTKLATSDPFGSYMYLTDFSLKYKVTSTGLTGESTYVAPTFEDGARETKRFPVRLVDAESVEIYQADAINRSKISSPIIVAFNNGDFELYIDEFVIRTVSGTTYYTLQNNLVPYELKMGYIATPATVFYDTATGTGHPVHVDCDLPEHMHVDVVKHAVDIYNTTLTKSRMIAQQSQVNSQSSGDNTTTNNQNQ